MTSKDHDIWGSEAEFVLNAWMGYSCLGSMII